MAFQYLTERFQGSSEKAEHFVSLLNDRVALSGSSILQITKGIIWDDSDLDIVTVGIESHTREMIDLIHQLTIPPLNYQHTATITRFHHTYLRLNETVHTIACFRHPNPLLPKIQIIFSKLQSDADGLYDFTHKMYDIINCEGYFDGTDFVPPTIREDLLNVLYTRKAVLLRQQVREWIRFFIRVNKYQKRGMTLSRNSEADCFFLFCNRMQYRPGKGTRYSTLEHSSKRAVMELLMNNPIGDLRVSLREGTGVYEVQNEALNVSTFIALSALEPLYNYHEVTTCTDISLFETPSCDNPLGIKIVYNDQCTTYENFQDFNKAIRFFRPCIKHGCHNDYFRHDGQPSICSIPLINGTISVYAAQLRDCIFRRVRNVPLVVVIESTPFKTYDLTISENIILDLSTYVSANHCQDGSNISVHLCRIAYNFPRNERRHRSWGYFNLERPTKDDDALPDDDTDAENDEQKEEDGPGGRTERRDSLRVGPTGDRGPMGIPGGRDSLRVGPTGDRGPMGIPGGEDESTTDNRGPPDELSPLPLVPGQANQTTTTTRDQTIQEFSQIFDFGRIFDSGSEM